MVKRCLQYKHLVRFALFTLYLTQQYAFAEQLKYNITGSYSWYPYFIGDQAEARG